MAIEEESVRYGRKKEQKQEKNRETSKMAEAEAFLLTSQLLILDDEVKIWDNGIEIECQSHKF